MLSWVRPLQRLFAVLLFVAFVCQGTMVLAGTTGSLSGTLVDGASKKPLVGARVLAASPSQSASATTDAAGHFQFLALGPDTYTVSVTVAGYDPISVSGVNVVADNNAIVSLVGNTVAKQIGRVASRSNSTLVSSGTTADVYSINATVQDKASALGGGGTLNSAWSAISSVPGVFIAPNQGGYVGAGATVSIRGGDYDQIGYELDGIPVNRSFDNYPSGPLSSLGQQEVQVYTGAVPATAEAQGISGYINQVIKTGTRPGSANLTGSIGAPAFYHKLSFEVGGATPDRLFSYYVGFGGYNQDYRYADQFQGASLSREYGQPLAPCPTDGSTTPASVPSCFSQAGADFTNGGTTPAYALGAYNTFFAQGVQDRDSIINLHFGIPRKNGAKDDIQLLYDNNFINTPFLISTNDQGGQAYLNAIQLGTPSYSDGYLFNGAPAGTVLPQSFTGGGGSIYLFPSSPSNRPLNGPIDPNLRDNFVNNQGIFKAQYSHSFGDNALLKLYGYTYYSNWLQNGPQTNYSDYVGSVSQDYELSSHTRGLSATFTDQLNEKNLLTVQGSYTTANSLRDNNTTFLDGGSAINTRNAGGLLVDGSNPFNGQCYSGPGAPVNCFNGSGSNLNSSAAGFTYKQAYNGTVTPATGTCGAGPCQYLVIGNGEYATYNNVKPKFFSGSITDQFRPSDKLNINIGLHVDRFEFDGSDTTQSAARQFLYTAYNNQFPNAQQFNVPSQTEGYTVFQPRFGATYTLNPTTVLRASYGRYAQAPNSAFEQYNFLQSNAPSSLKNFVNFGIGNTPAHAIRPPLSNNYDFSFEKQFSGQLAIKLTPFLRKTQDQIQQFYLDQKTGFVSGLNVGNQTSEGFEFEVDKGDFSRNGIAAKLSFAYTNSYIRYNREPNGASVVDGINNEILSYNGYTSACAASPTSKNCVGAAAAVQGVGGTGIAAPCYTVGTNAVAATATTAAIPGIAPVPTACAPGTVANPYWNASPQALLDPNANYPTFDTFPGPIGVGYTTYGAPYVATFLVQYKHGPLAITPAIQLSAGQRYGVPATTPGILPDSCSVNPGLVGTLGSPIAGDPRYPSGAPGGSAYDQTACPGGAVIPNTATGVFDTLGGFVAPSTLQLSTQISYDLSKKLTLVTTLSNLVYSCFGGTKVPFGVAGACGYSTIYGAGSGPQPIGNQYNPGNAIQPLIKNSYDPFFKGFPFNAYFEARIKL